jgi:hypothetical protein
MKEDALNGEVNLGYYRAYLRARTHRGIAEEIIFTYSCSRSHLRGGRHISRGWSHYASRMFPRQARPSPLSRHGSAREFSPDLREGTSPTFQRAQNRKPDWAWSISYCGNKRRCNTSLTNPKVTNHLFGNHLCNGKDQVHFFARDLLIVCRTESSRGMALFGGRFLCRFPFVDHEQKWRSSR